jgi:hypothetical protein
MVQVTEICPLRLYISETSCKLRAVHRYLIARIPDTYFIRNGRPVRLIEVPLNIRSALCL